MTPSDPLLARLSAADPAQDIHDDAVRSEALLAQLRTSALTDVDESLRTPGRTGPHRSRVGGVLALAASGLLVAVILVGALALLGHHTPRTGRSISTAPQPTTTAGRVAALTPGHRIHPILTSTGVGSIPFGAPGSQLTRLFGLVLGRPQRVSRLTGGCGADETLTWPNLISAKTGRPVESEQLIIFLDHGRFVGYQYGAQTLAPRGSGHLRLRATTTQGIALGDRLSDWRHIHRSTFHISSAQGGTWALHTPTGTLRGYTYGRPHHRNISQDSLIASIDAGNTGCPAVSP